MILSLYLGIIHALKCQYRRQLIWKTAATIDEQLLRDAAEMKLDVLPTMHLIAVLSKLITPTTTKNCSVKCGFQLMSAATMTAYWNSFKMTMTGTAHDPYKCSFMTTEHVTLHFRSVEPISWKINTDYARRTKWGRGSWRT
jgi:hypothetical protein